ncbi:MAG: lycopene cyclase family protein [Alphaproteobacteria bacterium]|nr:lycopene cyclase family protein [Alphaproteobacteria bacterium]
MDAFDLVICGAGMAGCILAHRLSADPAIKALLLAAGEEMRAPLLAAYGASTDHSALAYTPRRLRRSLARARLTGTSSSVALPT